MAVGLLNSVFASTSESTTFWEEEVVPMLESNYQFDLKVINVSHLNNLKLLKIKIFQLLVFK